MKFYLNIDPPTATAQQKGERIIGGTYIHHYEKRNVKDARAILRDALLPYIPAEPITGPIRLICFWRFRAKSHKPNTWRTTRPDTDNLQKLLKDVMTDMGFWKDDSQVCCEMASKAWMENPGIEIRIEQIEEKVSHGESET